MGCTEGAAPLPLSLPSAGCEVLHKAPRRARGEEGCVVTMVYVRTTRVCTRMLGSFVNMGPGMGWWKSRSFQKQVVFLGSSLASGPLLHLTWPLSEKRVSPFCPCLQGKLGLRG